MLELQEIGSDALPDSFPVTRVLTGRGGATALISNRWSHLLIGQNGRYAEFGGELLKRPVSVAFDSAGGVAEVIDAEELSILSFAGPELVGRRSIPGGISITAAVKPNDSGWWIVGRDSAGTALVLSYPAHGGPPRTIRLGHLPRSPTEALSVAAMDDGEIVVTDRSKPFVWTRVPASGEPIVQTVLDSASFYADPNSSDLLDPLWVPLSILPIDDHVLYTVADVRSNARRLILLTRKGEFVRETIVTAPMGLLATVEGRATVVGVRNINGQEVVSYRWTWKGEEGPDSRITSRKEIA